MAGSEVHIDLKHLDRYVEGDCFLRDEILEIFKEQSLSVLDKLAPELGDTDWHVTVHTLKGASRGIGAWQLGDMSEVAEKLVGEVEDKGTARAEIITVMRAQIESTVEEIRQLRDGDF